MLLDILASRDEPTSGLDSAAAYYVMAAVRRLAEHCRTVIRQALPACLTLCLVHICMSIRTAFTMILCP